MTRKYVPIVEDNEWEGERWRFYIPLKGNEEDLARLTKTLDEVYGGVADYHRYF